MRFPIISCFLRAHPDLQRWRLTPLTADNREAVPHSQRQGGGGIKAIRSGVEPVANIRGLPVTTAPEVGSSFRQVILEMIDHWQQAAIIMIIMAQSIRSRYSSKSIGPAKVDTPHGITPLVPRTILGPAYPACCACSNHPNCNEHLDTCLPFCTPTCRSMNRSIHSLTLASRLGMISGET